MALIKYHIGDFVEPYNVACNIPYLRPNEVSGIGRDKEFFEPSRQIGSDTSKYKVVPPHYFACNLMHVGRDIVLPIALNYTEHDKYVSPAYSIFFITDESIVLKEFFLMMMVSEERNRYFWFHTDSSVRDGLSWDEFCALEIELPDISIQQKYVDVYRAMVANQKVYEKGLDDLKLTCDIIFCKNKNQNLFEMSKILETNNKKNQNNIFGFDNLRGINDKREFSVTTASVSKNMLSKYLIVFPTEFALNFMCLGNWGKFYFAYNSDKIPYIVSPACVILKLINDKYINPYYLLYLFDTNEFQRKCVFLGDANTRGGINIDTFLSIKIPIIDNVKQDAIANMYNCYIKRKEINERLKEQIKNICPILIKGSLIEGEKVL